MSVGCRGDTTSESGHPDHRVNVRNDLTNTCVASLDLSEGRARIFCFLLQGAAVIPPLNPDILITESTYATTVRDSRRTRERELLQAVSATVANGGKVLIPVFALGSAQELSILLDEHWRRQGLTVCRSTLESLHDTGITSAGVPAR